MASQFTYHQEKEMRQLKFDNIHKLVICVFQNSMFLIIICVCLYVLSEKTGEDKVWAGQVLCLILGFISQRYKDTFVRSLKGKIFTKDGENSSVVAVTQPFNSPLGGIGGFADTVDEIDGKRNVPGSVRK